MFTRDPNPHPGPLPAPTLSFRRKVTISMHELLSVSPLSSRRETRLKHTVPEGRR